MNIDHNIANVLMECDCATPANTIGMGNPMPATDDQPGSGDLPNAKPKKKRKKFSDVVEGILDKDAGVDFEVVSALTEFKMKLKKYADIKLRRMNPLGYEGDVVDDDFNNVLCNLYDKTLKKYISKTIPEDLALGSKCQVRLEYDGVSNAKIIILWFTESPRTMHKLLIGTRYPTDNFVCTYLEAIGRTVSSANHCNDAAYLPTIFATELANFFKYKLETI